MALQEFPNSPAPAQDFQQMPKFFPPVPEDIQQRFPSAGSWNDEITLWYKQLSYGLGDAHDSVSAVANAASAQIGDILVTQGELTVQIETETTARIAADELIAQRIVTVSALAGTSSHISVQNAPPGAPALNDLWVNNTDPLTPVTYKWSGAAWIEVTDPISVAAVAAEQTARITADGWLEGKYSLTVIAGNVVTGMNITSASGPGSNISSVIFRATDFLIYNSVTGVQMFAVSGTNVNLASVLTVSTSGKVFTGTGTYGNANTYFYVDNTNHFSLGANLTWDGTTLTITGTISATTGAIGGFTIAASKLSAGSGTNYIEMNSAATSGFIVGDTTGVYATMRVVGGTAPTLYFGSFGSDMAALQVVGGAGDLRLFFVGVQTIRLEGATGIVSATSYTGSGASLTSLNASNISSGTLNNSRLPSAISISGAITSTGAAVTSGTKCEAPLGNFTDVVGSTSGTFSNVVTSANSILANATSDTGFRWSTPGGTVSQIDLGNTSSHRTSLRAGAALGALYLIDTGSVIKASIIATWGAGAVLTLNDSGGNPVVSFDSNSADGAPMFGTYVGTPGAITGYITVTDTAGNPRKLAVTS